MPNPENKDNPTSTTHRHHLGITLSGGAARGYAHVGFLKALAEHGLEPDIISGTSMGAVVGAMYAAGYSPAELEEILTKESVVKLVGFSWRREGMLKMDHLCDVLEKYLHKDDFDGLKKPFWLGVSNLDEAKKEFRNSGRLYDWIIASCSAPIVFAPKVIGDVNYADGGLLCNLPASAIRDKCEVLIGAHVNYPGTIQSMKGVKETVERVVLLAINQNAKPEMELCDYMLDPSEMQNYSLFDFDKAAELIRVGYDYALRMIASGDLPVEKIKGN